MSDYTAIPSRHPGISAARQALRRWRSPLGLATLLLVGVMSTLPHARADIITFIDLTDTVTISHSGTDTEVSGSCPASEATECFIRLSRPGQFPTSGDITLLIGEPAPQQAVLSDQITVILPFDVDIFFDSLIGEGGETICGGGSCGIQETGQPQQVTTITWSGGGTDSIFFQSDLEPSSVPEPGSWFLLATGLISLLAFGWRSRAPGSSRILPDDAVI